MFACNIKKLFLQKTYNSATFLYNGKISKEAFY